MITAGLAVTVISAGVDAVTDPLAAVAESHFETIRRCVGNGEGGWSGGAAGDAAGVDGALSRKFETYEGTKLWLAHVKRSAATATVYRNAAAFLEGCDKPLAEDILRAQYLLLVACCYQERSLAGFESLVSGSLKAGWAGGLRRRLTLRHQDDSRVLLAFLRQANERRVPCGDGLAWIRSN